MPGVPYVRIIVCMMCMQACVCIMYRLNHGIVLIVEEMMAFRAAPGMTCLSALEAVHGFGDIARNDSKGCGTIMRVAPVVFGVDKSAIRNSAMETSALTHGHPVGQMAAAAWAEIMADVLDGDSLGMAAEGVARNYLGLGSAGRVVADAIHGALRAPNDGRPETIERLGGGWVAEEALAIALYASRVGRDFEEKSCQTRRKVGARSDLSDC